MPIGPAGDVKAGTRLENGIMISTKARDSKNFVAMMQFIDWLWYSDAGPGVRQVGRRGHHLHQARRQAARSSSPDVNCVGLNPTGTKNLQKDFGFFNGVFAYGGSTELLDVVLLRRGAGVPGGDERPQDRCPSRRRTRSAPRSASRRRCGRPR